MALSLAHIGWFHMYKCVFSFSSLRMIVELFKLDFRTTVYYRTIKFYAEFHTIWLILHLIFKPVCQEISKYVRIFFHILLFVALVHNWFVPHAQVCVLLQMFMYYAFLPPLLKSFILCFFFLQIQHLMSFLIKLSLQANLLVATVFITMDNNYFKLW